MDTDIHNEKLMSYKNQYYSKTLQEIVMVRFGSFGNASVQLNVSSKTIQNAVTAKNGVSRKTAERLAEMLGLDFDVVFERISSHPTRKDGAKFFENQVARLLQLTGYEISKEADVGSIQVDFIARRRDLLASVEVLVECIYRDEDQFVYVKDISKPLKIASLNRPNCQLIIIANTGFTDECKVYANRVGINCRTLAELQNEVLDLQGYLDAVASTFPLPRPVIELDLAVNGDDEVAEERTPSRSVIRDFLDTDGDALLIVLGEAGSGKTTFCRMLIEAISDSNKTLTQLRIPVVITLRHFDFRAGKFSQAIFDSINKFARRRWDPQMLDYLESQGDLLVILDGLDELELKEKRFVVDEILHFALPSNAKVVLTSRPYAYQLYAKRAIEHFSHKTVARIQPLTQEQVAQYVRASTDDPSAFARLVDSISGAHELLQHPHTLALFLNMDDWKNGLNISSSQFYENVIRRAIMNSNLAESSEEIINAMSLIALEMYLSDKVFFSLRQLHKKSILLTQTSLMTNRPNGSIVFTNKSVMEYLVARWIARTTTKEQVRILSSRLLPREVASFLSNILESDSIETQIRGESDDQIFSENLALLRQLRASRVHQIFSKISIRKLQLNRIKCFDSLTLEFNTGRPTASVIVGDNGHGKSTLLQCIALCGLGPEGAQKLVSKPERFLRNGAETALMSATFEVFGLNGSDSATEVVISIEIRKGSRSFDLVTSGAYASRNYHEFLKARDDTEFSGMFIAGYGATRIISDSDKSSISYTDDTLLERVESLFNPRKLLIEPQALERLAIGDGTPFKQFGAPAMISRNVQARILEILATLLPSESSRVTTEGEFVSPFGPTRISEMSDGYRCTLAWATHLIIHLCSTINWHVGVESLSGVLLIDEIDLHLHPKWQRVVMSLVREAFPNLQLLTTTHSPLVVADADANEADVVLLREVEDRVEAVSDVSSTRGLRADQVLATEIFGYLIDRDPKTEERMRRASILAGKDYRSAEEESEYHSLIQLVKAVVAEGQTNFERKIASDMESELLDRASRLEDKLFGKEQP